MTSQTLRGMNSRGWDIIALIVALIALLCIISTLTGCMTQNRCYKRFPPQVKDSTSYVEKVRDTAITIPKDSGYASYLIDCENNKARIRQLLGQGAGQIVYAPTATINDTVLIVKAGTREQVIKYQVKELHYSAVKSSVFVKITNELTGWQWAQVWAGRLLMGLVGVLVGVLVVKRYWKRLPL